MEKKHTVKAVMFQYKYTDLQYMILVATCQTQGGHLLKQTLLYGLFYSKQDRNLRIEHRAVVKKTFNNRCLFR